MEYSPTGQMERVADLAQKFFERVLYDEEPLFVSDEATIWDVSMSSPEELITRIMRHYGKSVSIADLGQPFWKLLLALENGTDIGRPAIKISEGSQ